MNVPRWFKGATPAAAGMIWSVRKQTSVLAIASLHDSKVVVKLGIGVDWPRLIYSLNAVLSEYALHSIFYDSAKITASAAEELLAHNLPCRAFTFTPSSKREVMSRLSQACETRQLVLPLFLEESCDSLGISYMDALAALALAWHGARGMRPLTTQVEFL